MDQLNSPQLFISTGQYVTELFVAVNPPTLSEALPLLSSSFRYAISQSVNAIRSY